jgi:hypothetical protein
MTRFVQADSLSGASALRAFIIAFLILSALSAPLEAFQTAAKKPYPQPVLPAEALGVPRSSAMNVNNVTMWVYNNGTMERRVEAGVAGVTFPEGTATVVYGSGLLWGGVVRDSSTPARRVGGQSLIAGTVPGRILSPGVAEHPDNADVRVFRVRRAWATADLRRDAAEIYGLPPSQVQASQMNALRDQYKKDWLEWPWQKGAPYYERNGIPGYQPNPDATADSVSDEPGLAQADQVLWFVANDLDESGTRSLYGSAPIGLEEQVTCWAFATGDELNNVVYQRYRLIYKGTSTTPPDAVIDSMYITKWSDVDLGSFNDDLAGSDRERQLGYVYNARPVDGEFLKFDMPPPAVGYDLHQGPRVPSPGAQAFWNLGRVSGYRNLPMTSFTYFTEESRISDYDIGAITGSREWYNVMRGYQAQPIAPPVCLTDPTTQACEPIELWGDPVTFRGWVDGRQDPLGDRRIALSSGPFSLAYGDTQEVVLSFVGGTGQDNRDAVTAMKAVDAAAQDAFNLNFEKPATVPEPTLKVVELDQKLIFDWESDTTTTRAIEEYFSKGYRFETYIIYQLPRKDAPRSQWLALPPFDITLPRFVEITKDYLRDKPLANGQTYYFVVSAVMANPDPTFGRSRIESAPVVRAVVPHSPNPGIVYPYSAADVISESVNIVGNNEAVVHVSYFNPAMPDGHTYKVFFHRSPNQAIDLDEKPTWDLIDATNGDSLLHLLRMDTVAQRVPARGFTIELRSPLFGLRNVYEVMHDNVPHRSIVYNVPDDAGAYMVLGAGTSLIDTVKGGNPNDTDVELRFRGDSSWALFMGPTVPTSRWVRVPYTAWEVGKRGRDSINRQVYTVITDRGADSVWRPTVLLDREYNGRTLKVFYPMVVVTDSQKIDDTYSIAGQYDDSITTRPVDAPRVKGFLWINGRTNTAKNAVWKAYIADLDEDGVAAPEGTVIRFERFKAVRNKDEKLIFPSAVRSSDLEAARAAVARVSVFPNPYYGLNRAELDRFNRFVTFNHLPQRATIRIFNLAGEMIRVIQKDDPSQFATWDLNNQNGLRVGAGVFLAHIGMEDASGASLGETTLKLLIVPEKQFLQGAE